MYLYKVSVRRMSWLYSVVDQLRRFDYTSQKMEISSKIWEPKSPEHPADLYCIVLLYLSLHTLGDIPICCQQYIERRPHYHVRERQFIMDNVLSTASGQMTLQSAERRQKIV